MDRAMSIEMCSRKWGKTNAWEIVNAQRDFPIDTWKQLWQAFWGGTNHGFYRTSLSFESRWRIGDDRSNIHPGDTRGCKWNRPSQAAIARLRPPEKDISRCLRSFTLNTSHAP